MKMKTRTFSLSKLMATMDEIVLLTGKTNKSEANSPIPPPNQRPAWYSSPPLSQIELYGQTEREGNTFGVSSEAKVLGCGCRYVAATHQSLQQFS